MRRLEFASPVLLGSLILTCILGAWSAVFSPIFITIHTSPDDSSVSTAIRKVTLSGAPASPHSATTASTSELRITRIGNGKVEIALPIAHGVRLKREQLTSIEGCWESTFNSERLETCSDSGPASIRLPASGIEELPFLAKPSGGTVRIQLGSVARTRILRATEYGWSSEALPLSDARASIGTISVLEALLAPRLSVGQGHADKHKWGWRFGHEPEYQSGQTGTEGQLQFDKHLLIRYAVQGIGRLWSVTLGSTLMLALACIMGISIAGLGRNTFLTRSAIGISITCLAVNSASYFAALETLRLPMIISAIALIAIGLFRIARHGHGFDAPTNRTPYYAALSCMLLIFWPLLFTPATAFLGFLQTDSFYYTNVSSLIKQNALFQIIAQGSYVGHGMRSIDLATAAALQTVTGLQPGSCWVLLSAACALILPICSYRIGAAMGSNGLARLSSWSVALGAAFTGIFFEAYLAQFMLSGILFYVIYTGVQMLESRENDGWLTFAFSACCTVAILLYPYFSIPVPVMAFAVLLDRYRRHGASAMMRLGGSGAAAALLLGNVGYYFLSAPRVASQFTPSLNAIASNVVFPFMWDEKFPQFLSGVAPFHGDQNVYRSMLESAPGLFMQLTAGINMLPNIGLIRNLVVGATLCIYGWSIFLLISERRMRASLAALNMIPFAFTAVAALAYFGSGAYAYAKVAWTGATFLPVILAINTGVMAESTRLANWIRITMMSVFMAWTSFNAVSKLSEPAYWTVGPTPLLDKVSSISIADEIGSVHKALDESVYPGEKIVLAAGTNFGSQPPPQKLLVLAAHIGSLIENSGARCVNCMRSPQLGDGRWFRPATKDELHSSDAMIIIDPYLAHCVDKRDTQSTGQVAIMRNEQAGDTTACFTPLPI